MRLSIVLAAALGLFGAGSCAVAQEMPEIPKPQKEHQWLEQLAGEWNAVMECSMGPDQPPMKAEATQSSKMIGGRWLAATGQGDMMGTPMTSVLTLGFDPAKKKYVDEALSVCGKDAGGKRVFVVDLRGEKVICSAVDVPDAELQPIYENGNWDRGALTLAERLKKKNPAVSKHFE